jgi:hypothetical protein
MKTLHLTLKKKWFDMIASGEKTEEYRYLSYFFCSRLLLDYHRSNKVRFGGPEIDVIESYETKSFDTVTFTNGYRSDSPKITLEFKGIEISTGNPEWGAEPGKKYFVIKLGEKII